MCMSERGFCLLVSTTSLSIKFLWILFSLFVSECRSCLFLSVFLPPSCFSHVSSLSCGCCLSRSILLSFLYIPWPLTCHHSWPGSRDGAGEARVAALSTNASSGQCERKKTTQLLQSPELIYAAAVSKAPSLWHCRRRNQHRLLPSLHASLAVVGKPFHWSLTTRFCIS